LNILALGFNVWPSDDAIGTQGEVVGGCRIIDATPAATYIGFMRVTTLNALRPVVINAAATYTTEVLPSTTIPMTWAANDEMACSASLMAIRV
jgi:hypothetical protein